MEIQLPSLSSLAVWQLALLRKMTQQNSVSSFLWNLNTRQADETSLFAVQGTAETLDHFYAVLEDAKDLKFGATNAT